MYELTEFEFTQSAPKLVSVSLDESIEGELAVLDLLDQKLSFADYCGRNWDALVDCLSDLSPSLGAEVVIDHASLPKLVNIELKRYLKSLIDARNRRDPDEQPILRFVFRNVDREAVALALNKIGQ